MVSRAGGLRGPPGPLAASSGAPAPRRPIHIAPASLLRRLNGDTEHAEVAAHEQVAILPAPRRVEPLLQVIAQRLAHDKVGTIALYHERAAPVGRATEEVERPARRALGGDDEVAWLGPRLIAASAGLLGLWTKLPTAQPAHDLGQQFAT